MRTPTLLSGLLLLSLAFVGCSPKILSLQDTLPTVGFRGIDLSNQQAVNNLQDIQLELGLRFLFRNPFGQALPIPAHQVTIKLDGDPIDLQLAPHRAFVVPAEGQQLETYAFTLDLSPGGELKDLLGADHYLSFEAEIPLDLDDFVDGLADYGIAMPKSELSDKLRLQERLKARLGQHTLTFSFGDTIRLPLLPAVGLSSRAGHIRFLGEMDTLDLGVFQDAIVPFVDQVLTAELQQDLIYPFIAGLKGLDCPSLTGPRPCIELFGETVEGFINASTPLLGQAKTNQLNGQWDNMYTDLLAPPEAGDPVLDQLVGTWLPGIQPQLDLLQTQWASFKAADPVVAYPGSRVTGLEVTLPFVFKNPNQFAVEAPSLFTQAQLVSGSTAYLPARFEAGPAGSTRVGPGDEVEMTLTMRLAWGEGAAGLYQLMAGQQLQPRLQGGTAVDLGYGPLRLAFDLPGMRLKLGQ